MRRCSIPCKSRPPCPLRPFGAPPPRGGGLYGSIRESTLPQLFIIHQQSGFIIQYSFVPSYHPACLPATPCRWRSLREADSLPYRRKGKPRAVGADIICPPRAPTYHPACHSRQYCAKGDLFRTPREGRPYGQTDKLLHYSIFICSNASSRLSLLATLYHFHRSKKPPLPKGGVGGDSVSHPRQHCAKGALRAPSAPAGHLPREGEVFAYACKDRIVLKIKASTQGSLSEEAGSAKGRD